MARPNSLSVVCDLIVSERHDDISLDFALEQFSAFGSRDEIIVARAAAIGRSYGRSRLTLPNKNDKARVVEFILFVEKLMIPSANTLTNQCLGMEVHYKKRFRSARRSISSTLDHLEPLLEQKTYILGSNMTFADIGLFCVLIDLFILVLHPGLLETRPNLTRWFRTVLNQPEVQRIVGSVNLCQKPAKFDATGSYAQYDEIPVNMEAKTSVIDTVQYEKTEEGAPENGSDKKLKKKFKMKVFKKKFFNDDPVAGISYFWERFDPNHFSIWHCQYKYPEDVNLEPASSDFIYKMAERLNPSWEGTFASMCLFGEDISSRISGLWIWRGQEISFNKESAQYDSWAFHWRRLDPEDVETKTLVREYFTLEGDFNGQILKRGIIFR